MTAKNIHRDAIKFEKNSGLEFGVRMECCEDVAMSLGFE